MKKVFKNVLLGTVLGTFAFALNVNATTLVETTDSTDGLSTIEKGTIVVGVTKFSPNKVLDGLDYAKAGINFSSFYSRVGMYIGMPDFTPEIDMYMYDEVWIEFTKDEEGEPTTKVLNPSNEEDAKALEDLEKLSIVYVDNKVKELDLIYVPVSEDETLTIEANTLWGEKNVRVEKNDDGTYTVYMPAEEIDGIAINEVTDSGTKSISVELMDIYEREEEVLKEDATTKEAHTIAPESTDLEVPSTAVKNIRIAELPENKEVMGDYYYVHKYNMEVMSSSVYSNQAYYGKNFSVYGLYVPLVAYKNASSFTEPKQWFALLVETNNPITKEDVEAGNIEIILKNFYKENLNYKYHVEVADVTDAKIHGGSAREFLLWLHLPDAKLEKGVVPEIIFNFKENGEIVSTDSVNFRNSLDAKILFTEVYDEAPSVHYEEEDVNIYVGNMEIAETSEEKPERKLYIFYIESNKNVTEFKYSVGDTEYIATYNADTKKWDIKENLYILDPLVGNSTPASMALKSFKDDHKWNQESIEVSEAVKDEDDEDVDYVITVSKTRELTSYVNESGESHEWYSLIMNLGVDPSTLVANTIGYGILEGDYEDVATHYNEGIYYSDKDFVMWLKGDDEERIVTFKNDDGIELTVKFVVEDSKIPALNVTSAVKTNENVYLYETSELSSDANVAATQGEAISAYRNNAKAVRSVEVKKSASQNYDFEVVVQAKGSFKAYSRLLAANPTKYAYATIALNFADGKTTTKGVKSAFTISKNEAKLSDDENAIIAWIDTNAFDANVDANNRIVEFKSDATHNTVKVLFTVNNVLTVPATTTPSAAIDTNTVFIDTPVVKEAYASDVVYNETESVKEFVVNTTISEFAVADKNGVEYTYKKVNNVWKCVQSLVLTDVKKGTVLPEFDAARTLNANALKSVSKVGSAVNVVFDRNLSTIQADATHSGKYYAVLVDLGIAKEKVGVATNETYTINVVDVDEAYRQLGIDASENKNYIVLWLNENDTKNGRVIRFVNKDEASIEFSVLFKSSIDYTDGPVDLGDKFTARALDMNSFKNEKYTDDLKNEIINNNEGLIVTATHTEAKEATNNTPAVEESYDVEIAYDKPFKEYSNGYPDANTKKKWFGFVLDLGVDPSLIESATYKIGETDYEEASLVKFSSFDTVEEGSTEFIMWLDAAAFTDNKLEIKFNQKATSTNANDTGIKVTFKLKNVIKNLELKTVRMAKSNAEVMGEYATIHAINQAAINVKLQDGNIVYTVDGLAAKYDNGVAEAKWFAVLVDFGVDPSLLVENSTGYNIEVANGDIKDAKLHGENVTDTEFVMWLRAEDLSRDITFKNAYNDTEYSFQVLQGGLN